jgi:hypothetical protein
VEDWTLVAADNPTPWGLRQGRDVAVHRLLRTTDALLSVTEFATRRWTGSKSVADLTRRVAQECLSIASGLGGRLRAGTEEDR